MIRERLGIERPFSLRWRSDIEIWAMLRWLASSLAANEETKALDDLELRRSISEFLLSASERTE
jgi:hypothetical protein